FAYDVDAQGGLSNPRLFAEIENGMPDGFRVDVDGNLWIATIEAGICVYASDAELIGRVEIPGPVCNLTFGGEYLNRLFITGGQKLYGLYTGTQGISTV